MSKKILTHQKAQIRLEPDGFSIHTFELSMQLGKAEWDNYKEQLYADQKKSNETWIYADKSCKGLYICTKYTDTGIRIRLEHISSKKEHPKYFIRIVVNPRKLIYPQSGYLGILPPEEDSIELLEKTFRHQFRKSPFEKEFRKYYLSRVDLCTNIRCDNKKVFRELVRLLRKTATPKKYERKMYQHKDRKKANQYNKHYIRIACDSQELVIYDKTYQINENDLIVAYEGLPSNVLRIEVHYGRDKLRRLEKSSGTDDPLDLLWQLMQESEQRICKLVGKCYPDQPYLSYENGLAAIDSHDKFPQPVKDTMSTLLTKMRRTQNIDNAFQAMEQQGIKTDGLLNKFRKLGINPIPLLERYSTKHMPSLLENRMPSLTEILHSVSNQPVNVALYHWKWK